MLRFNTARFPLIGLLCLIIPIVHHAGAETLPSFASREGVHNGRKSEDVILPCQIENLGDYGVIWARESAGGDINNEDGLIFTERNRMPAYDDRFEYVSTDPHDSYNWDIRIRRIEAFDQGTYKCQVLVPDTTMIQRQVLEVKVPPSVNMVPEKSPYVVEAGQNVAFICYPSGNPTPKVIWTRKGGPLPSGQASVESRDLHFENVSKFHEGTYTCTADNGVGRPAESEIQLQINSGSASDAYPPRVSTDERKMLVKVSDTFNISCKYIANPPPNVEWFFNGYPLQQHMGGNKERMKIEQITRDNSAITTIIVADATLEDFGDYTCRIVNNLGKDEASVFVTGLPTEIKINIDALKNDGGVLLYWHVDSIEPILNYQLDYRIMGKSLFSSKFLKADPKAKPFKGLTYEGKYELPGIEPESTYEIVMKAQNKNGWGRPSQAMFKTGPATNSKRMSDGLTQSTRTSPNKATVNHNRNRIENFLFLIAFFIFHMLYVASS